MCVPTGVVETGNRDSADVTLKAPEADGQVRKRIRLRAHYGGCGNEYVDKGEKAPLWRDNQAMFVEVLSRIFFPLTFVVFNVLYWVFYIVIL